MTNSLSSSQNIGQQNSTTRVTSQNWFQRLGNSIKDVLVGLIIFVLAFPLLVWNEGRAISTHRSLQEGASVVVSADANNLDASLDGKLIHISGELRTPSVLTDETFAISEQAIKLRRVVEMYQWIESKESKTVEKFGGSTETTTTYTYNKDWSERLIDSSQFVESAGRQNPSAKSLESEEQLASLVSLGVYTLPERLLRSLSDYQRLNLKDEWLRSLPYAKQEQWQLFNNYFYQSSDPSNPSVGDLRVWYQVVRPGMVSVIASQKGDQLEPYRTSKGQSIEMIRLGNVSAEEMFQGAIAGNQLTTWLARVFGFLLMFMGLNTILGPLAIVASLVPLFARIIRFGTKLVAGLIAFILSLTTIAIAWLWYRPLVSIGLFLLIVVIVLAVQKLSAKKSAE